MVESNVNEEAKPQGAEDATSPAVKAKRNWADDDGEEDEEGGDRNIGGSEPVAKVPKKEPEPPKIPKIKREKNAYGDFIVTKIEVKERVIPKMESEDEEESEEESDSEPEPQKEEEPEEVKSKYDSCVTSDN